MAGRFFVEVRGTNSPILSSEEPSMSYHSITTISLIFVLLLYSIIAPIAESLGRLCAAMSTNS